MTRGKHRSIGERLTRAKSPEARRELLHDWVANWERDALDILDTLNAGIEQDNDDLLTSAAGQLRSMIEKRFGALRRVLGELTA